MKDSNLRHTILQTVALPTELKSLLPNASMTLRVERSPSYYTLGFPRSPLAYALNVSRPYYTTLAIPRHCSVLKELTTVAVLRNFTLLTVILLNPLNYYKIPSFSFIAKNPCLSIFLKTFIFHILSFIICIDITFKIKCSNQLS